MREKDKYRNKEDIIINNKFIKGKVFLNRYMYKKEHKRLMKILIKWCYENGF